MTNENLEHLLGDLVDTLAQDERILTSSEESLLAKVVQHVQSEATSEVEKVAADLLSRAVGAAVMDRVLGVISVVIAQRLLRPQTMPTAGRPSVPETKPHLSENESSLPVASGNAQAQQIQSEQP
jgi:hypothetical protein